MGHVNALGYGGALAATVIVCVLACAVAQADVEYIDFCDYYPLAVGDKWQATYSCSWGTSQQLEIEIMGHRVENGIDVWMRERRMIAETGPFLVLTDYVFFLGSRLRSLPAIYEEELSELPAISEHMDVEYRQRYPVGVPVNGVTVQRGTLAEMLSLCHGVTVTNTGPLDSQLDAIALVRESGAALVFAYGTGYVDETVTMLGECWTSMTTPVTPIANDGCPRPLSLTSTNLGEVWEAGSLQTITWQRDTEFAGEDVRIGLHQGAAFVDWIVRKTANDGEYTWAIPPDRPPADNYRLRIQSFTDNSIRDYSDGLFSITPPVLTLTSPNGGEVLRTIFVQTISWLSDPSIAGADVRIGLHRGAAFLGWITRRTANDGEYQWIIPEGLPSASNYRLRVQSCTDNTIRDLSDRPFVIVQWPQ